MAKRTLIRVLIGVAVLVVFIAGALSLFRTLEESRLEKWKRDMRAQGEKFLVSELAPGPVVSNAMLPRLAKALDEMPASPIAQSLIRLGETNRAGGIRSAWRATNAWPEMHKLLDDHAERLHAIREAIKLQPKDLGHDYTNRNTFPGRALTDVRQSAHWLTSAVIIDLHRGHRLAALTNLLSLLDLVKCQEKEASLIMQMIRGAMGELAFRATWELMQAGDWSDEDLAAIQSSWERVAYGEPLEFSLRMERATALVYYDMIRRGTNFSVIIGGSSAFRDRILEPAWRLGLSQSDELSFLRNYQKFLTPFRRAREKSSGAEILDQNPPDEDSSPWLAKLRFPIARAAMLSSKFGSKWLRMETERQLALAAIALARFRLRHGKYPQTLAQLTPDILTTVPVDFADGNPLRYEQQKGGFRLRSAMEGMVWPQVRE